MANANILSEHHPAWPNELWGGFFILRCRPAPRLQRCSPGTELLNKRKLQNAALPVKLLLHIQMHFSQSQWAKTQQHARSHDDKLRI